MDLFLLVSDLISLFSQVKLLNFFLHFYCILVTFYTHDFYVMMVQLV